MKKIFYIAAISMAGLFAASTVMQAQSDKKEQKIKVIVKEGNEATVVIDTVIYDSKPVQKLRTNDGNVVVITSPDEDTLSTAGKGKKSMYVTVLSDGKGGQSISKTVTVVGSDSTGNRSHARSYSYTVKDDNADDGGRNRRTNVFVREEKGAGDQERPFSYTISKKGFRVVISGDDEAKTKALFDAVDKKLDELTQGSKK
jgi:hypothetical protein